MYRCRHDHHTDRSRRRSAPGRRPLTVRAEFLAALRTVPVA
jgi:hypothetical protein